MLTLILQTFDNKPESGADVLTSACTSLKFGCLAFPSKLNRTDSLVVINAPLCRRRCNTKRDQIKIKLMCKLVFI